MPEFTHTYSRELVNGQYNINNPVYLANGQQVYLADEIEVALPGKPFVIRAVGAVCNIIFTLASDLTAGEVTTLDAVVAAHKAGGGSSAFSIQFPGSNNGDHLFASGADNPPNPSSPKVFSWCGWVRADIPTTRNTIGAYWDPTLLEGWFVEVSSLHIALVCNGTVVATTAGVISQSVWTFIAVSYDGATARFYWGAYGGGSLTTESIATGIVALTYNASSGYRVGGNGRNTIGDLEGYESNAILFDATLGPNDFDTLYNGGVGLGYADMDAAFWTGLSMLCYHTMDDAGVPVLDAGPGSYDLGLYNAVGVLNYQQPGPA